MKARARYALAVLRHPLGGTVAFIVSCALFLKFLLPYVGGWVASGDMFSIKRGLPSSGKEFSLYMILTIFATFCYLAYSSNRWQRVQEPIWDFLRWRHPVRHVGLILAPFLFGGLVFFNQARGGSEPVANPIRHPTPPDRFSKLTNPYRNPGPEQLEAFDNALRSGDIDVAASTEEEVVAYAGALAEGTASPEMRRSAYRRRVIEEGRELFFINCRPCHGAKGMGDGPMSVGQRRRPLEFNGVETIALLVEGAVFWRVNQGGIKLPREGAPWESAMPRWETDLTEDQMWKIIMAEYDLGGTMPREPEGLTLGEVADGEENE